MSHNTLMKAKVKWKGVTFRKEYWLFNETLTDCFLLTWWCWRYTFFREDWGTESCGGGKQEYWDVCSSNFMCVGTTRGFPGGSDSKGSACNAGDPGSIPGSGRSLGEVNGYPFQYSFLVNSMDRGALRATVHGVPAHSLPPPLKLCWQDLEKYCTILGHSRVIIMIVLFNQTSLGQVL